MRKLTNNASKLPYALITCLQYVQHVIVYTTGERELCAITIDSNRASPIQPRFGILMISCAIHAWSVSAAILQKSSRDTRIGNLCGTFVPSEAGSRARALSLGRARVLVFRQREEKEKKEN